MAVSQPLAAPPSSAAGPTQRARRRQCLASAVSRPPRRKATEPAPQQQVAPPTQQQNGHDPALELGAAAASRPAARLPPLQPAVRLQLHYRSSWLQPILHHSLRGGEWSSAAMQPVVSGGGWWKAANLHVDAGAAHGGGVGAPLLEFVLTDGQGAWDKAPDGENYAIAEPGAWALRDGQLARVATPPVLLVSDLDDTMIGDDAATAAFTSWWREEGVPAGGRLVYNTGRALDLFEALLEEKRGVLAEPDRLISSIGTRVYSKRGGQWVEDEGYTAMLGRGWQLEAVREACYRSLAQVGKDAMHFRPPSEMSDHKVTCGVRLDVLDQVLAGITAYLRDAGVAHRLVASGKGDWRYLDLVPAEAGKLQALEYVRRSLEFEPGQTVACGDSGNDIDMLEGHHLSIVVGNAHEELLEWARTQRSTASGEMLLAAGHRAHGILEGLQHFGFKA